MTRADLIAATEGPAKVAGSSPPITASVLVSASDGQLRTVATDLAIYAARSIPTDDTLEPVCVNARKLADVARNLPDGPVTLRQDGTMLVVAAGRSRTKLLTSNAADFPALPTVAPKATFTTDALADALKLVRFAVGTDDTRRHLTAVRFRGTAEGITLEAADGHRASRVTVPLEAPRFDVLVPADAIDRAPLAGTVTVRVADACVQFSTPGAALTARTIDAEYPDLDRLLRKPNTQPLKIGSADLAAAVKRVSVVTTERAKGVRLVREGNTLTVEATSPEHGAASDVVTMLVDSAATVNAGFNARYLSELLAVLDGHVASVAFGGETDPAWVTCDSIPNFFHVLMPMQLH